MCIACNLCSRLAGSISVTEIMLAALSHFDNRTVCALSLGKPHDAA